MWKTTGVFDSPITWEISDQIISLHASLLSSGQITDSPSPDEKNIVDGKIEYSRYWTTETEATTWKENFITTFPNIVVTFTTIQID